MSRCPIQEIREQLIVESDAAHALGHHFRASGLHRAASMIHVLTEKGHSVQEVVHHLVAVRREKIVRRFCHQGDGIKAGIDKLIDLAHGHHVVERG